MSIRLETAALGNPSSSFTRGAPASMALRRAPPAPLGFGAPCRGKIRCRLSVSALPAVFGVDLRRRSVRKRSVLSLAASHEESAPNIDIEKEKVDQKVGDQESQEAWKDALASFKQEALKMLSLSKDAYELYSEKALIILKETSESLKIQAEKAGQELAAEAKVKAEESKEYLATAPEPVKDVVDTLASLPDESKNVGNMREFYVGIPYGILLSVGGFIWFMITGSIPAIRFGVILGGTLLALSLSSLRLWKKGEISPLMLTGQTAIVTILLLREMRLFCTRSPCIGTIVSVLVSLGVFLFYSYKLYTDGGWRSSFPNIFPED
ncbi:transmembrane proteins 14C [Striga asiatica]|uniref:Transmembrane proteins 14C n=1 Tax=Striga asiatica TaxID=4170 RepID=A0A5A7REY8_STRAF|nr:transmembrane proteins 14C [Striga asiatica]